MYVVDKWYKDLVFRIHFDQNLPLIWTFNIHIYITIIRLVPPEILIFH